MEDRARLDFECGRIELLQLLIRCFKSQIIDFVGYGELLDASFELSNFLFCRGNDVIEGVDVRGLGFATDEIDIDMWWDGNVLLGD